MADKQIIIDCKYKYQNIEKFNGEKYCLCFNDLCKNLAFACDKNCQIFEDYKQLQQLKTENIKFTLDSKKLVAQYSAKLERLKQKLKEIKTISNTYKGVKEMDEITRIINRRK